MVSNTRGLFQLSIIVVLLVLPHVHKLTRTYERGEELWAPLDHVEAQSRAPRVTDQKNFRPAQTGNQELGDFQAVAH
jgi:hypothetical protein